MGWAIDDEPVQMWKLGEALPIDLALAIEDGASVIAHNAPFELVMWNNCAVKKYGWPRLKPEQVECTAVMAYAMALPGSLEKAALAAGIKYQKDMQGSRIMLQLCQPRDEKNGEPIWWDDPEKYQRLYAYCAQDVEVERELHKRLMRLSLAERELWQIDYRINQRGIVADIPAIRAAIEIVELEKKRLDDEMRAVTEGYVMGCGAIGRLKEWIKSQGVDVEGLAKNDVAELLDSPGLKENIKRALLLRQEAAKSSTAKLEAMLLRADPMDARIRMTTQFHAAGTGRWGGRGIQPQNMPRPRISQEEIDSIFDVLRSVSCTSN